MNSNQLKCFLEVAKELNFAKAAQNLHFSQPSVSKQIQSLEEELKVKLFERNTRSVSLTNAGRLFFPNAKSIYRQELDAIHNLSKLEQEYLPRLLVGSYGIEVFFYMHRIYSKLMQKIPGLQPDVIFAPYQSLSSSLKSNAIDMVVGIKELIEEQSSGIGTFEKLTDAPITYILPENISISARQKLYHMISSNKKTLNGLIAELFNIMEDCNIKRRVTSPVLESALRSRLNIYELAGRYADENVQYCDNVESAFLQVKAGNAFFIMPQPEKIKNKKLINLPLLSVPSFHYGFYCHHESEKETVQQLKKELQDYFSD